MRCPSLALVYACCKALAAVVYRNVNHVQVFSICTGEVVVIQLFSSIHGKN